MNKSITTPHKDTLQLYSVSELNTLVQSLLETRIGTILVRGEISNLATPNSGHTYFSLKDEKSQIRCAMFRNKRGAIGFEPKNGVEVLATGLASLYTLRGDYQLIVDSIELSGDGILRTRFEALKEKLNKKGLFDENLKKVIPTWPRRIGIVTSTTGAAIKDLLVVMKRRCPAIPAIIYPCSVQGTNASSEISTAIHTANQRNECDVLILGRGGGSLEDLWPFNEEIVADAIYNSKIPVVTGIGHQIDFTIADLVADVRAPTPSAAAELVTPDVGSTGTHIVSLTKRLLGSVRFQAGLYSERLLTLRTALRDPAKQLELRFQQTDDLFRRLTRKVRDNLKIRKLKCLHSIARLLSLSPKQRHKQTVMSIQHSEQRLKNLINAKYLRDKIKCNHLKSSLNNLGPINTLGRGYSIVRDENGKIVKDSAKLKINQEISTALAKGSITSTVGTID